MVRIQTVIGIQNICNHKSYHLLGSLKSEATTKKKIKKEALVEQTGPGLETKTQFKLSLYQLRLFTV